MSKITVSDAQELLREAGWPENLIVKAAAVMGGESSYRTNAGGPSDPNRHKDSNGRWSVGLLQINATDGQAPGTGRDGLNLEDLEDPLTNLTKAYAIYRRQGWGAWGAAGNGSYQKFMAASQAAYNGNGGSDTSSDTSNDASDDGTDNTNDTGGDGTAAVLIGTAFVLALLLKGRR